MYYNILLDCYLDRHCHQRDIWGIIYYIVLIYVNVLLFFYNLYQHIKKTLARHNCVLFKFCNPEL